MRQFFAIISCGLTLAGFATAGFAPQHDKKKYQEPKPQVLPLPAELPTAITADTDTLDFHISPLLRTGGLSTQIRLSLNDLIRDTHGETIVKLRAFVAGTGDARRVQSEAVSIFTDHRLQLPVLSIIQVGGLAGEAAQVVIEAVVSTHKTVNPSGLAFITGQYGRNFEDSLQHLKASAASAKVAPDHLLTLTCFTSAINDYEGRRTLVQAAFPKAEMNIVQALRDPATDATMCEAVGQLTDPPSQSEVVRLEQAHTTLVRAKHLVFTGLQLCFGSFLDDAHEAHERLRHAANAAGGGMPSETFANAAVQINAFSLTPAAGSALRKTTSFPPSTFTVLPVEGLTAIDATAGVDAILAVSGESATNASH
jgi:enamine deaminase RidA (YjgF/YER057c/UK114 family)